MVNLNSIVLRGVVIAEFNSLQTSCYLALYYYIYILIIIYYLYMYYSMVWYGIVYHQYNIIYI